MSAFSKSSLIPDGFVMGVHLAGVLGLRSDYFSLLRIRKNIEVIQYRDSRLINDKFNVYVKLDE